MLASQTVESLVSQFSSRFTTFMTGTPSNVSMFSSQETTQGKLQMYALLALFLRREGQLSSSDRFLSSAVTISRSLYDDLASPTTFETSFGLWLLAFAMSSVDSTRGKHIATVAMSTFSSIKFLPAHMAPHHAASIAIMRSSHVYSLEPITFKADFLAPLRPIIAPLLALDPTTIDFERPELLVPVNFDAEMNQAILALLIQNNIPDARLPLTESLLRYALLLSLLTGQEAVMAHCEGYLPFFFTVGRNPGTLARDVIPREIALALGLFCVKIEPLCLPHFPLFACELSFSFFYFFLYQSLGNMEKAKAHASIALYTILKTNPHVILTPVIKVVYPAYILGLFMAEQGMRQEAILALELIRSFLARYSSAEQAAMYLEERLGMNSRKRPFQEEGAEEPLPNLPLPLSLPLPGPVLSTSLEEPPDLDFTGWTVVAEVEEVHEAEEEVEVEEPRGPIGTPFDDRALWLMLGGGEPDQAPFEVDLEMVS